MSNRTHLVQRVSRVRRRASFARGFFGALVLAAGVFSAAPSSAYAGSEAVTVTYDVTPRDYNGDSNVSAQVTNIQVVGDVEGTTEVVLLNAVLLPPGDAAAGPGRSVFAFSSNPSSDTFAPPHFGLNLGTHVSFSTVDIDPKPLTIEFVPDGKEYDGSATTTGSLSVVGKEAGDDVTATFTSMAYGSENEGAGQTATAAGLGLAGADAGNYALQNTSAQGTGTITPHPIDITAQTATKVYDATNLSPVLPLLTSGTIFAGDTFAFTQIYTDKLVAGSPTKTLTPTGVVTPGPGRQVSNYLVTFVPTSTGSITIRTLTVSITADDKPVDGTTDATVTLIDDRVGSDVLTITSDPGTFDDAFVGEDKTVTVTGITLAPGGDADNYVLGNTEATTLADITPVLGLHPGVQLFDSGAAGPLYSGVTTYTLGGDLDLDGDKDLVNVTPQGVQIFHNEGNVGGVPTMVLKQELEVKWSQGGGAIDCDNDGDLDLVLGAVVDVKILRNDGSGFFVVEQAFPHGFAQPTVAIPYHSRANSLNPASKLRIAVSSSSDNDVLQDLIGGSTDGRPHLYRAIDPNGANPLNSTNPVGSLGGVAFYDLGLNEVVNAMALLSGVDPRFRTEVPNFVSGATDPERIQTLTINFIAVDRALTDLDEAKALISDVSDLDRITAIENLLLAAQLDIVAQAIDLGAPGTFPLAKQQKLSRQRKRNQKRARVAQAQMQQSIALARSTGQSFERDAAMRRANRLGKKALRNLSKFHKSRERAEKRGR